MGTVGAGKTTLLRYVGRRSDGTGGVFLGSEADDNGTVRDIGWESAGLNDPDHPNPRRRAIIYATRDPADAREVADRIAVLHRGRVEQCMAKLEGSLEGFLAGRRDRDAA